MFYRETHFKETGIGEMPRDWQIAKIRDVVLEAKSGFASGRRNPNGILQLRMDNIDTEGHIRRDAGVKIPVPKDFENYLLRSEDILFNNTNSVDMIGKTAIFTGEFSRCVYSNHLTRIRTDTRKVLAPWILYLFMRKWRLGVFKSVCHRHVHQAGINNEDLLNLGIPVAPLSEQKAIVRVLGVVDSAILKVDEVIAKTERLKKGLMQELLTKGIRHKEYKNTPIGRVPEDWEVKELSEVTVDIKDTEHKIPRKVEQGVPFVSINYMIKFPDNDFVIDEEDPNLEFTSEDEFLYHRKRFDVELGDVLYSKWGTIARAKFVNTETKFIASCAIALIKPNRQLVNSLFLTYALNSEPTRRRLFSYSKTSTRTEFHIGHIKKLKIPIPSLAEQRKIAEILSTADNKLDLERKEKTRLERIKRGLMDLLLTGKVRVKVD